MAKVLIPGALAEMRASTSLDPFSLSNAFFYSITGTNLTPFAIHAYLDQQTPETFGKAVQTIISKVLLPNQYYEPPIKVLTELLKRHDVAKIVAHIKPETMALIIFRSLKQTKKLEETLANRYFELQILLGHNPQDALKNTLDCLRMNTNISHKLLQGSRTATHGFCYNNIIDTVRGLCERLNLNQEALSALKSFCTFNADDVERVVGPVPFFKRSVFVSYDHIQNGRIRDHQALIFNDILGIKPGRTAIESEETALGTARDLLKKGLHSIGLAKKDGLWREEAPPLGTWDATK